VSAAANLSQPYTNPDGMRLGACIYCGYCERFGCEVYAKPSATITVLPVAQRTGNFELRTHARVTRINLNAAGDRAESVTYVDAQGREFEQPADIILLTSYVLNNVRLLLHSGIGTPYNPSTGEGTVGKNYAYQAFTGCSVFFDDKTFNLLGSDSPPLAA
jgi:gluconate 2-dehydrogenase alpha chain